MLANKKIAFPRYIYGLFNGEGRCFYVGQTRRATSRAAAHRRKFGNDIDFRRLDKRWTSTDATIAENLWIAAMILAGEPLINKYHAPVQRWGYAERPRKPVIVCMKTGAEFVSVSHVANTFGIPNSTAQGWFSRYLSPDRIATGYVGNRRLRFKLL